MNSKVKSIIKGIIFFGLVIGIVSVYKYWLHFVEVSGNSMYPTYQNGTTLLVTNIGHAKRGDTVDIYSDALAEDLCKRLIALEGDTVEIKKGIVYVNGEALKEEYNEDDYTNKKPIIVPQGYVYVMGDNRLNSLDSRKIGPIPAENLRSIVLLDLHIPFKWIRGGLVILIVLVFAVWMLGSLKKENKIQIYNPKGVKDYDSRLKKYTEKTEFSQIFYPYVVFVDAYETEVKPSFEKYGYPVYETDKIKSERIRNAATGA